jgi:tetratricopeptide (TPR) repeat protein
LAVAYFQQGVSNFLVGDFEEALANFNDTLLYLRGNTYIDYEQLGLKFRLYSCEVLFNRGLCYMYLQQDAAGMQDFDYAVKEKMTPDHEVINDAIREKAVVGLQASIHGLNFIAYPFRACRATPSFPYLLGLSTVQTKPKSRT